MSELAILAAVEWLQLKGGEWGPERGSKYPLQGKLVRTDQRNAISGLWRGDCPTIQRFDDEYRLAKENALTDDKAAAVELDAVESHLDQEELSDGGCRYMAVGNNEYGLAIRCWTLHTRPDITAPVVAELKRGQVVLVTHMARIDNQDYLEDQTSTVESAGLGLGKTVWLRCGRAANAEERLTGPARRPVGWTRAKGRRHQIRININPNATFDQKRALLKALYAIPHFKSAYGGMDAKARFGRFHVYSLRITPRRANRIIDHVVVSAEFQSRNTAYTFMRHIRHWAVAAMLQVENTVAKNRFRKASDTTDTDGINNKVAHEISLSQIVDLTNPEDQPESTSRSGENIVLMPVLPGQTLMISEHQTLKRSVLDFTLPWEALKLKNQPQQTYKLSHFPTVAGKLSQLGKAVQRRNLATHESLFDGINQDWEPTKYRLSQTFGRSSTALARLFRCCQKQKLLPHERAHYMFVKSQQDLEFLRNKESSGARVSEEALANAQERETEASDACVRQLKRDADADQQLFHWTMRLKETQVLVGNVLTCALDENEKLNSPRMVTAVTRAILASPNSLWTAYDLAEAFREQADFPPNENCSDDVRKYNRIYAETMTAVATSIAYALDIPKHKDKDIAAWLQPKLNFEPGFIGASDDQDGDEDQSLRTSESSQHEQDVEHTREKLYVHNVSALSTHTSSDDELAQRLKELFKAFGSVVDAQIETEDNLPADKKRCDKVFTDVYRSVDKNNGKILKTKEDVWGVVTMGESEGAQDALRCIVNAENGRELVVKMYRECIVDKLDEKIGRAIKKITVMNIIGGKLGVNGYSSALKRGKKAHGAAESALRESGEVEDRGRIDAGPLYLSICQNDINFNSVPWIMAYVATISEGALALEEKYEPVLPTSFSKGFISRATLEMVRVKYYRELVKQKVWPRWLFTWMFYLWCGFQVPYATFKSPTARYAFGVIMYFFFLSVFTWAVALDEFDAMHMGTSELIDRADWQNDRIDRLGLALYTRSFSWLYLLGSLEKELRQLARLGLATYTSEFWNWVELLSPLSGIGGLVLIEFDDSEPKMAREMLSLALVLLWCRLLQLSRASETIGPLIPVIVRMLAEVAKFGSVMAILIMGFSVAMYTILQPKSNEEVQTQESGVGNGSSTVRHISVIDAPWFSQFETLSQSIKTMSLASIGAFEMDYTGAKHESMAGALMAVFIVLMVLALLNLLITLLMRRYDEVSEEMAKQFAFVRASAVFWEQDSMLDDELPPPFNLVQIVHPEREKLAWLVWLAIWTPVQLVLFVAFWGIATILCGPWKLLQIVQKAIVSGAASVEPPHMT
eukprot:COSAG01_NODE_286_length_19421_cov_123.895663_13_plen_1321_part_00